MVYHSIRNEAHGVDSVIGRYEAYMSRLIKYNDHILAGDLDDRDPFLSHLRSVLPRGNWEVFK